MEPSSKTNDEPATEEQCSDGPLRTNNLRVAGGGRERHFSKFIQEGGYGFERSISGQVGASRSGSQGKVHSFCNI